MRVNSVVVCIVVALLVVSVCGCKTSNSSTPSGWASASWNPANWTLGRSTKIGSTTPPDFKLPQKPSVSATASTPTPPGVSYPSTGASLAPPTVSYQNTTASYNSPAKDHGRSPVTPASATAPASPSKPYMAPQKGYYSTTTPKSTPSYQPNNPYATTPPSSGYVPVTPAGRYANQSVADSRYNVAPKQSTRTPISPSYGTNARYQASPAPRYGSPTTSPPTTNNYRNTPSGVGSSSPVYPSANQTIQNRFVSPPSPGQQISQAIGETKYPKTGNGLNGYTPGATGYQPGNSSYQPGKTDYRPGATGYTPPNTSSYQSSANSYQPPRSYTPPTVSTGSATVSPDGTSPDRTSPDRTSPDRTSPDRTSPDRTSPYRPGSTSTYTPPSSPVSYPSAPSTAVSTGYDNASRYQ